MTLVIFLLKMVFQSTLPRGERRLRISVFLLIRWISIHAPTRGATRRNLPVLLLCSYFNPRSHDTSLPSFFFSIFYFNPRSHEGSDRRRLRLLLHPVEFQSTLPRGERQIWVSYYSIDRYFNPRSHEGSDGG